MWLVLFALVANPIVVVGACAASFGVADAGNSLLQPEYTVLYEKWTYRLRDPRAGDQLAGEHPVHDAALVGTVTSRVGDEIEVEGHFLPPRGSVAGAETIWIEGDQVDGKVLGSFGGSGDEDLASFAVFAAPWVIGFSMLLVAVSWAERIRRGYEGSSRWWPLPVVLWGIGTLFYACGMELADKRTRPR